MFCDQVVELLEPIAAGDVAPDEGIARHLASCVHCADALAAAGRVDRLLRARAVPEPSSQFTTRTLARIRRDRWRREQFLDTGFNVAIATVISGVVLSIWMVIDRSGLSAISRDIVNLFGSEIVAVARELAPSATLYAGATALIAAALAIWWWAERDAVSGP
jgi:predicted anti-sigma-YlaC factor YlaD